MKKKAVSSKAKKIELTLWDVILSYPSLYEPKQYKGKSFYQTDVLMEPKSQTLKELTKAIKTLAAAHFGDDQDEWPEKIAMPYNGDEREDQAATYAGKYFVSTRTNQPVPVVDLKGKAFNAQAVRGGMYANVAVTISVWENDGEEGLSIYLSGVQIDTTKQPLTEGFGGGRSVKAMFSKSKDEDDSDDSEDEDDSDDEDEEPVAKKKPLKKKAVDEDEDSDEDDSEIDEDAEDEVPVKKKKVAAKKKTRNFDEDED